MRPPTILHINNKKMKECKNLILLEHTIDKQLTFKGHIDKLHVLRRTQKYLTPDRAKLLCSAFVIKQFNYASVI